MKKKSTYSQGSGITFFVIMFLVVLFLFQQCVSFYSDSKKDKPISSTSTVKDTSGNPYTTKPLSTYSYENLWGLEVEAAITTNSINGLQPKNGLFLIVKTLGMSNTLNDSTCDCPISLTCNKKTYTALNVSKEEYYINKENSIPIKKVVTDVNFGLCSFYSSDKVKDIAYDLDYFYFHSQKQKGCLEYCTKYIIFDIPNDYSNNNVVLHWVPNKKHTKFITHDDKQIDIPITYIVKMWDYKTPLQSLYGDYK